MLRRGFTLTEVLITLALISLLTVIASPTFVKMVRDRRVARAAGTVVDYMRTARTMAIGRGQPMLLSWNGGSNTLEINEPLVTKNSASGSCTTTGWKTASTQLVNTFTLQSGYEYTDMQFYDEGSTNKAAADICFTPTGRMYMRTGATSPLSGAFSLVMGVPTFAVTYKEPSTGIVGVKRTVYLMPNGTARMQL